jgi:hypothetical protein
MPDSYDKHTIAMILGLLFPGAGHILMGRKPKGICIAIVFVFLSYVSGIVLSSILNTFMNSGLPEIFFPFGALAFIPSFALWIYQVFDLSKIVGNIPKVEAKQ